MLLLNLALFFALIVTGGGDAQDSDNPRQKNRINADSLFRAHLSYYKIPDSLITSAPKRQAKNDTTSSLLRVILPGDVVYPVFIKSLNERLAKSALRAESHFQGEYSYFLNIYQNKNKILTARITRSPQYQRRQGALAIFILIRADDNFNLTELDYLPAGFYPLVYAEKINPAKLRTITQGNNSYGMLLDGEIKEVDFKLDFSFSESRFSGALNNIFSYFSGVNLLLLSHTANFYLPSSIGRITRKSAEKGIPVIGTGLLVDLRDTDSRISLNEIELFVSRLRSEEAGFILMDAQAYLEIKKELFTLKEQGIKMLSLAEIVRKAGLGSARIN